MIVTLKICNFNCSRNTFKANVFLLFLSRLVTQKLFAIQHWYYYRKVLGIWNLLMLIPGFPNASFCRVLQIGSQFCCDCSYIECLASYMDAHLKFSQLDYISHLLQFQIIWINKNCFHNLHDITSPIHSIVPVIKFV